MISLAIVLILLFCSSLVCLFSCTPSSSGPRTPPSSSFHIWRPRCDLYLTGSRNQTTSLDRYVRQTVDLQRQRQRQATATGNSDLEAATAYRDLEIVGKRHTTTRGRQKERGHPFDPDRGWRCEQTSPERAELIIGEETDSNSLRHGGDGRESNVATSRFR